MRERETAGAFIRVYDGRRWYYSSLTALDGVQAEIDRLAALAAPDPAIGSDPVVARMPSREAPAAPLAGGDLRQVPLRRKDELLRSFFPLISGVPAVSSFSAVYRDTFLRKEFVNSRGGSFVSEQQLCGMTFSLTFSENGRSFSENIKKAAADIGGLENFGPELKAHADRCLEFLRGSRPVPPGKYTVVLSPLAAGIFAHESFGHKSEADFMLGSETMRKEWQIGKKLGPDFLHIADEGSIPGSGYAPYDDEGAPARRNWLIKDGRLAGRLHSAQTAAALDEGVTGNARAMNFEFEPIVRMTTTYFAPGNMDREALFAGVKDGLYVDTVKHGSGMSTFTLAPSLAYFIKDGRLAGPAQISVITGSVFDTFGLIDAISDKVEIVSSVTGGCGKDEQYPLPVAFGGPCVRVRGMSVM